MIDHCTGWFEGWWSECCRLHDLAYDAQVGRLIADNDLSACVAASLPHWASDSAALAALAAAAAGVVARVMYAGVRAFGARAYTKAARQ